MSDELQRAWRTLDPEPWRVAQAEGELQAAFAAQPQRSLWREWVDFFWVRPVAGPVLAIACGLVIFATTPLAPAMLGLVGPAAAPASASLAAHRAAEPEVTQEAAPTDIPVLAHAGPRGEPAGPDQSSIGR